MSNILDFNTGKQQDTSTPMDTTPTKESLTQIILTELYNDRDKIKDVIVFVKFNSDDMVITHSGPMLSDKCLAVQLLQHDINLDIQDINEGI